MRFELAHALRLPARRLLASLALLVAALAGCLDPIPANTLTGPAPRTLVGAVLDACSRAPVKDALVVAHPVNQGAKAVLGSTNAEGHFVLAKLDQGSWEVLVSRQSYRTNQQVVRIGEDPAPALNIYLNPDVGMTPISATVDVLFVVDNSHSMGEEQENLASGFPQLVEALLAAGIALDLHVGVISSDLGAGDYSSLASCATVGGDNGRLQRTPRRLGCTPPSDPWISYNKETTNIPGEQVPAADQIAEAFRCIALLGTAGCGYEQPLEALRTALDPSLGVNPGFLRDDSTLLVVIVSDEDDCSARRPQLFDPTQADPTSTLGPLSSFRCFEFGFICDEPALRETGAKHNCRPGQEWLYDLDERYLSFLRALRPAGNLYLGVISGPASEMVEVSYPYALEPSCQSEQGSAVPALRLLSLVEALSPNSSFDVLCNADLGPVLQALAYRAINAALLQACPAD